MLISVPAILSRVAIRGVIHVGAHHGWEIDHYLAAGIERMVLVEPNPNSFAILQEKLRQPSMECFNVALGNHVGTAELFLESANMGQSCSLLEPAVHLQQYPHIIFEGSVSVPVTKLDLLPIERSAFNFLNIDVQGYELEVLRGGVDTLRGIDAVLCEVNRDELYKGCPMVEEIDVFMFTHGFTRDETCWAGGTWGDALYLRG